MSNDFQALLSCFVEADEGSEKAHDLLNAVVANLGIAAPPKLAGSPISFPPSPCSLPLHSISHASPFEALEVDQAVRLSICRLQQINTFAAVLQEETSWVVGHTCDPKSF